MLSSPRIGQRVQVHYAKSRAHYFPYHDMEGVVVIRAKGPGPRNHAVRLCGGTVTVVPAGNLVPMEPMP